ncbi:MAG TPA: Asp-tRNA(Asn)/Glu-tRNA(Gln) amidotransferase subunit GatB [Thermomicrobiales bacterium]|nr:Asp-tRNA(Asn)/Glu-tRNA(Gln) amidotransferase subunit GatB [Thermomicrobiales bacterium]
MEFETVIGLEVHTQLLTRSKMFCGCSAEYFAALPNTHVCPVCLGLPGVLPVVNKAAVEAAVMTGLAFGCTVPPYNKFDRKNYFYPDLPKGYQISQYDLPLAVEGALDFALDGAPRRVGITRVHMEEDTGRLLHAVDPASGEAHSLVDLNRAGVPLLEIVGEPDLRSPEEARAYLMALRQILRYLGVSTGNMEEGAFRCDANISLRPAGSATFGAKVEVKNMNSFRAVERALAYEVERQRAILEAGGTIAQETRGWSEERGATLGQRTKEYAEDYRYFPEPDLPPLTLDPAWVEAIRARMPELPAARRERFARDYALREAEIALLTEAKPVADYFEAVLAGDQTPARARLAANWVTGDLFAATPDREALGASPLTPARLRGLLDLLDAGAINRTAAKQVFGALLAHPDEDAAAVVARLGLGRVSAEGPIREAARQALAENPQPVADFLRGKTAARGRLVGATMKLLGGRGDAAVVGSILDDELRRLHVERD